MVLSFNDRLRAAHQEWLGLSPATRKQVIDQNMLAFAGGFAIGKSLSGNIMSNRPDPRTLPKPKPKHAMFLCQCGCNEMFEATWTTAKPKYKDNAHKQRAYRRRVKAAKAIK